ncbi:MAG: hypothetical protein D8H91_10390 [Alloprevotella sp.]|nr:MAG: hypothetical protein D8H91_10390 [Alloprevotella sp.]
MLAFCFSLVLAVAHYAFELTVNNLLNNLMKSVQDLMTDLGLTILFSRGTHHPFGWRVPLFCTFSLA